MGDDLFICYGVCVIFVIPKDLEKLVMFHMVDQFLLHSGGVLTITTEHPAGVLVTIVHNNHVLLQLVCCLGYMFTCVARIPGVR